jgi:hypothetical protein
MMPIDLKQKTKEKRIKTKDETKLKRAERGKESGENGMNVTYSS